MLTVRLRDAESAFGLCLKGQGGAGRGGGSRVRAGGFAHQGSSATTWSTYEGASLPGASGGGGAAGVSSEPPRLSLSNSLSKTAAYSATAAPSSRRTMLLNHRKPLRNDLNPMALCVGTREPREPVHSALVPCVLVAGRGALGRISSVDFFSESAVLLDCLLEAAKRRALLVTSRGTHIELERIHESRPVLRRPTHRHGSNHGRTLGPHDPDRRTDYARARGSEPEDGFQERAAADLQQRGVPPAPMHGAAPGQALAAPDRARHGRGVRGG